MSKNLAARSFPPLAALPLIGIMLGALPPPPAHALWVVNGVPVCTATGPQRFPATTPDGARGVFVAWTDERRAAEDVYLTRLLAGGVHAPGWSSGGLAISTTGTTYPGVGVVTDGTGGVLVVWIETAPWSLHVQRVDADGSIHAGWPDGGRTVSATIPAQQQWYSTAIVADGYGGAYVAFGAPPATPSGYPNPYDVRVVRIDSEGTRVTGWPVDGATMFANVTQYSANPDPIGGILLRGGLVDPPFGVQTVILRIDGPATPELSIQVPGSGINTPAPSVMGDATGGVFLSEGLLDPEQSAVSPIAQHYGSDGLAQWQPTPALALWGRVVAGAGGGAFVTGVVFSGIHQIPEVHITHLDTSGDLSTGWTTSGRSLMTNVDDESYRVMLVGADALVVLRNGLVDNLYASLVSPDASVSLTWFTVTDASHPVSQPALVSDGQDGAIALWNASDGSLRANRIMPATAVGVTADVAPSALQLSTPRPNPASREVEFACHVPGDHGADLMLVDLSGRVVARRALAPGASAIQVPLDHVANGLYWARLRQDGYIRTTRVVVMH